MTDITIRTILAYILALPVLVVCTPLWLFIDWLSGNPITPGAWRHLWTWLSFEKFKEGR